MLLKGMFQVKNKLNSADTQFGLVMDSNGPIMELYGAEHSRGFC